MINAGVEILVNLQGPAQPWVSPLWKGIKLKINYPSGQTSTLNPVTIGDILVDKNGHVWEIKEVSHLTDNIFICSIEGKDHVPSDRIVPDIGSTTRGCIVTPNNGEISPWWDESFVSMSTYRRALQYSDENKEVISIPSIDDSLINDLMGGDVPTDLNTLFKLANAVNNKVDKITGKSLSQNDFTDFYKNKLDANTDLIKVMITVTNWSGNIMTCNNSNVRLEKAYDDSALKVIHNFGKYPITFSLYNLATDPIILLPITSTRTVYVTSLNECLVNNCVVSNNFQVGLLF